MIKGINYRNFIVVVIVLFTGCSGAKTHNKPIEQSLDVETIRELWSEKLSGLITDLNISKNGSFVLVSTIPDPDRPDSSPLHQISLYSKDGQKIWQKTASAQIKSQAISETGELSLYSSYNEELTALDKNGNILWTVEANCRPIPIESSKRIVCFHDDDAEPGIAFDTYDWSGKKISSYSAPYDALNLKISTNWSVQSAPHLVLGLARGRVVLFDPSLRSVWKKKVQGEIADVAVSSEQNVLVAVLFNSKKAGQKLAVFNKKGKIIGQISPSNHSEQVEISPDGNKIFLYGNGPRGQFASMYELIPGGLQEKWHQTNSRFADYASPISLTPGFLLSGLEQQTGEDRESDLIGLDFEGKMKWQLPVETEEGAYLYSNSYTPGSIVLAVGNDDSELRVFEIFSGKNN